VSIAKSDRKKIFQNILDATINHPKDLVNFISKRYFLSRQSVSKYIRKLESYGKIEKIGTGKGSSYSLKETKFVFEFSPEGLNEDEVWVEKIKPILPIMKADIYNICTYGFTEILNNAIDHADANKITVRVEFSPKIIRFIIIDDGVGIFKKIQRLLNLSNVRYSILELAKGKLTSDPSKHSGEGIFFTSRAFDNFDIISSGLLFNSSKEEDFLIDILNVKKGTAVIMSIDLNSNRKLSEIFDKFSDVDSHGFNKTTIPVKLMEYEGMKLISRSQAKRLISHFDKFQEIILDFEGVEIIGQAFADELFRVFGVNHPEIHLVCVNTNLDVNNMIKHVLNT
jgi:anti-sigma regulatory factor (Ser/Thr protein kinase)